MARLGVAASAVIDPAGRWASGSLAELCDHIEQTHHAYLKLELPRLQESIGRVVAAQGARVPEIVEVQQAFAEFQAKMVPHMFKEEQILFPAIRRLAHATTSVTFPFGRLADPIEKMEEEHGFAEESLGHILQIVRDDLIATDTNPYFRTMFEGLDRLERDVEHHVFKERHILFPRAVELERARMSA